MMRRLVFATLATTALLLLLLPMVYAEGPIYCSVHGRILNPDGSPAANGIQIKITIQDTLDKATGDYISQTTYTRPDPFSTSGYYFVIFTQGQNCNYGEPVVIEVYSDGLTGKTTSVLVGRPAAGQYDVVLGKETSTLSAGGSSAPGTTGNAAVTVSDQLMCRISGFVKNEKTSLGENGIPVTVILQDTKGKATGGSIPLQTETRYSQVGGDGYFYVAFGPNADCNVGEPVKIIAQKETQFGETDSFIVYSPAKGQYDVLLKPLSENVTNTVRTNPSTIILTTFGLILLVFAIVYMKRRGKIGH